MDRQAALCYTLHMEVARGHVSHRHVSACDRPRALERGIRTAFAPSQRRALRRESEPPSALLPVSGRDEAFAFGSAGSLPGISLRARHRSPGQRHTVRRGRLGISHARGVGAGMGSLAERHGGHAIHVFSAWWAAWIAGPCSASSPTPRAARDVPPGQDDVSIWWVDGVTYRDVYHQNEVEQSNYTSTRQRRVAAPPVR